MDESPHTKDETTPAAGRPAGGPRVINLAVVAGAIVLIGVVAFALYLRGHALPPAAEAPAPAPAATPETPLQGTPITAQLPVRLSPEASIVAERYRCVCSCKDPLNVCTCTKTPGSRDMRQYVQQLVDQKKTAGEIDRAMVTRYGATVLIAEATATPTPAARKKR